MTDELTDCGADGKPSRAQGAVNSRGYKERALVPPIPNSNVLEERRADRVPLTDAVVRSAVMPSGKRQHYLYDTTHPGLAVRLRERGGKTFVFFFFVPGRIGSQRYTIGPFPKFRVRDAQRAAKILIGQLAAGQSDLNQEKREAKEKARQARVRKRATLAVLLAEEGPYEQELDGRGVVNRKPALSALRRNLLPDYRGIDVRKLTLLDVSTAMDRLAHAGKPGAAADLRKHTSGFLVWAKSKGYTDHNVLAGYRKPKQTRAQALAREEKGRALSDDEIRKVWEATASLGSVGQLVRLCLLGGARRSEPARICWSTHIMADRITFDARWTKMGRHHDVPRTHLVDEVLEAAEGFRRGTSDQVFPGSRTGGRITGWTNEVSRLCELSSVQFTLHDLRRTARTVMSKCGFDDNVQRLAIGQKVTGLDALYNKDEQWTIRKLAFEAMHGYIAALIEGQGTDKVVLTARASNPLSRVRTELLSRISEAAAGE